MKVLIFLACLAVTPASKLSGKSFLKIRRMLGLFAFAYALAHFLTYLVLDKFFDLHAILKDVRKHLWITAGVGAFVLMIPLAVTSTDGMIRRLGKNWGRLHRLVYAAAVLGVIHFLWLVKKDKSEPLRYAAVLAVLLSYRLVAAVRAQRKV